MLVQWTLWITTQKSILFKITKIIGIPFAFLILWDSTDKEFYDGYFMFLLDEDNVDKILREKLKAYWIQIKCWSPGQIYDSVPS